MADASSNNAPQAASDAVAPDPAASVSVVPDPAAPGPVSPAPVATAEPLHATRLSTLLESGKYSDLTLLCGSRKWKAHKSVLCIQSDFFAKACDGDFQEAQTNSIDLSEEHEHAVAAMIHFMYHGNYDSNSILPEPEREAQTMQLHIHVVGLAQKYFIEPLKVWAKVRAMDTMKAWDGAPSSLAEAVHEVYTSTADTDAGTELRQHALSVAIDNATRLFSSKTSEEDRRTREILIDETPGFIGEWATGAGLRNSTQASTIVDLSSVNATLNTDNVNLNEKVQILEKRLECFKAQARQVAEERNTLRAQVKGMPFKKPAEPKRPTGSTDPAPQCYLCPNCEALFIRSIAVGKDFHHLCYDKFWTGKLGKGGISMSRDEWQKHLAPQS